MARILAIHIGYKIIRSDTRLKRLSLNIWKFLYGSSVFRFHRRQEFLIVIIFGQQLYYLGNLNLRGDCQFHNV